MVKDDIGGLIAEGLGGEVVQQQQSGPEVIDMTTPSTENTQETNVEEVQQEQPVETAEQKVPTFTEQEENTPIEKENPIEEENYQNDSSFLNEINDSFETDFESVAELKDAISDLMEQEEESESEYEYANEQVANIDKFVRETGRNVSDYLRTQTADYSKLSDEQVVKEYLRVSNPELTGKEIDVYYNANYSAEKSEDGEPTLSQIQLKKDASTARKEMTSVQDSYRMPVEENSEYSEEEVEAIQNEWLDNMVDEIDNVESVSFDINDNESFDFQLTDEHKEQLAESNADISNYFDRYVDEEGNWDFDKLNMDMFIRDNFEDIVRSVANQYRSKGTEQVINDIKNPSFDKDQKPTGTKKKSVLEQVSDKILGDSSFWGR